MSRAQRTLWHYTDAAGLHGIITSGRIRLGDARFLNDRTEREYGVSLITEVLADELQSGDEGKHFLAFTAKYMRDRATRAVHVCSFSEVPTTISQWQRYGADGYGYCLGFSHASLRRLQNSSVELRKVIYRPSRQREIVRTRLRTLRAAYEHASKNREESMPEYILVGTSAALSAAYLDGLALELKDPSFSDEREWRLIHRRLREGTATADAEPEIRFTARGNIVKPFVELELRPPKLRPALSDVVCGPRLDGELAVATTACFLRSAGHMVEPTWSELHKVWR